MSSGTLIQQTGWQVASFKHDPFAASIQTSAKLNMILPTRFLNQSSKKKKESTMKFETTNQVGDFTENKGIQNCIGYKCLVHKLTQKN